MIHKKQLCGNSGEIFKEVGYVIKLQSVGSQYVEQSPEIGPTSTQEPVDPQIQISNTMGYIVK